MIIGDSGLKQRFVVNYKVHQNYSYEYAEANGTVTAVGLCQTQWSMSPNTAVSVGSTTTFTCRNASKRAGFVYRDKISDFETEDVCREGYGGKYINRCNVTTMTTDGTYTLTISDIRLSDAGFYSCGDPFDPLKATAHLLVLGKNLQRCTNTFKPIVWQNRNDSMRLPLMILDGSINKQAISLR